MKLHELLTIIEDSQIIIICDNENNEITRSDDPAAVLPLDLTGKEIIEVLAGITYHNAHPLPCIRVLINK